MSFLHKCSSFLKKRTVVYIEYVSFCAVMNQCRANMLKKKCFSHSYIYSIFCACHSLCQVQRSVAPRCGCELNAQCVMCSGRAFPPADTQHQLPLLDRLAQFDPCVHPILSFTDGEDTPPSYNCLFLSFFPVCTHVCRQKQ